ncbi:hypothetical protein [Promicromonospora sp. NPDC050880]|uniref:hypothetical protein n=1 Tax=Promicromonospora sp. NPDC050880 TaxID=3364406 RepID=UPI0037B01960
MSPRLTVGDAAQVGRRHPETLRKALQDGALHGTQRIKRGPWTIQPECLAAWLDNEKCEHQLAAEAASTNVRSLGAHRAARTTA